MDIKDLNAFRMVVETGTVTRAAMQLRRTQSAVSRIVAGLEDELGFPLFERTRKRLTLTAEGHAFFRETERLLANFDDILDAAHDIRDGRFSRIRIVSMPALAHGLLPDAIAAFQRSNPRSSVSVDVRRRAEVTRWIAGRQFDIGVATLPIDYPGIATVSLAKVRALAVLPKGHPLVKSKSVSLLNLASEPLVGLGADAMIQSRINKLFGKLGRKPNLVVDTSSLLAVCHFVASGLGCGIVDPFTARAAGQADVAFRPLEPRMEIEYGLLFEKDQVPSDQIRSLCETIKTSAKTIVRHGTGQRSV